MDESTIDLIKKLYLSGTPANKIATIVGYSTSTVTRYLKLSGIKIKFIEDRLTPDQVQEVLDRYNSGESLSAVADYIGCTPEAIRYHVKKSGHTREVGEAIRKYHAENLSFNIDFFRILTPEMAYVLGLWASDGNVHGNRLFLDMTDADVIQWVAEQIKFTGKIDKIEKYRGFNTKEKTVASIGLRIRFRSQELADIFKSFGITERKSKTIQFPNLPDEMIPHFISGLFDGDGCIYVRERWW